MILVDKEKIVQVQTFWLKSYASEREEDKKGVWKKMVDVMENDKKNYKKYCTSLLYE